MGDENKVDENKSKSVTEKYETGGLIIAITIILFIVSLVGFIHLYATQNNEIKETLEKTLDISHTNFMQIVIDDNTITNTNSQKVYISKEEFYASINRAFESHYTIVRESVDSIVKNQTNMLSFWFSFLSIVMVVFTVLGIFINNRILENAKSEARNTIKDIQNEANTFLEKLENEYKEKISNIETKVQKIFQRVKYFEKLTESIIHNVKINNNEYDNNNNEDIAKANNLFSNALKKNKEGNVEEAINLYSEVIRLNEKSAAAYNNRGLLYLVKYNDVEDTCFDKADSDFNNAIKYSKKAADTYNNKGVLYSIKYSRTKNEEDYRVAKHNYEKALEIDKNFENSKIALDKLEILKNTFDKMKKEL